jgi:hypothetical protein
VLFGRSLREACRVHDFMYCTRAWPPGRLDQAHRREADRMLGRMVRAALPFGVKWLGWLYYWAVERWGGRKAYDSCGREAGEVCRHNLSMPPWMCL